MIEFEFKTQVEKREWKLGKWTTFTRCAVGTVRWWRIETKNWTVSLELSGGRLSFEIERW
jgi:hypothetical protein